MAGAWRAVRVEGGNDCYMACPLSDGSFGAVNIVGWGVPLGIYVDGIVTFEFSPTPTVEGITQEVDLEVMPSFVDYWPISSIEALGVPVVDCQWVVDEWQWVAADERAAWRAHLGNIGGSSGWFFINGDTSPFVVEL